MVYEVERYTKLSEEDAQPTDILYHVESYHSAPSGNVPLPTPAATTANELTLHNVFSNQIEVIAEALEFVTRLEGVSVTAPAFSLKSDPASVESLAVSESNAESGNGISLPIPKSSKTFDGSDGAPENKNRKKIKKMECNEFNGKNNATRKFSYIKTRFLVNADQNGTASLTFFDFTSCRIDNIILFYTDIDEIWIKCLAKVSNRSSVLFSGLNQVDGQPRYTIILKKSDRTMIYLDGLTVTNRVVLWKFLGSLISIYPSPLTHPSSCICISKWLTILEDVLCSRTTRKYLCSEISATLAHHNYLTPNLSATLADIVAYSVIKSRNCQGNFASWLWFMNKLLQ